MTADDLARLLLKEPNITDRTKNLIKMILRAEEIGRRTEELRYEESRNSLGQD